MKRIYRSEKEKMLCGVCGGLAEYLRVDPVLIRLAAIALFVVNPGIAIILYIAACVLMPKKTEHESTKEAREESKAVSEELKEASKIAIIVVGALLIAAGVLIAIHPLTGWSLPDILAWLWNYLVASAKFIAGAILAVVGIALIATVTRRSRKEA